MRCVESIAELRSLRKAMVGSVGFVPTMGFLHEGHLALVRAARAVNDVVVSSIFVNPTQFGPNEDYATYPRNMPRDLAMLEREDVDLVFTPSAEEMYRPGSATFIDVVGLTEPLEGTVRPGHFRGVGTVVGKLFHIVAPTKAYFGQKDAQQVRVIQKMVADLNFDIIIVVVPTVREPDGLAMSSRNVYLGDAERKAAIVLSHALRLAETLYGTGVRDAALLRSEMLRLIGAQPLAMVDYVSVADSDTLSELTVVDRPALVSLAVRFGKTRLIDNTLLSQ